MSRHEQSILTRFEPLALLSIGLVIIATTTTGRVFGSVWKPTAAIGIAAACGLFAALIERPRRTNARVPFYGVIIVAGAVIAIRQAGGSPVADLVRSVTGGGGDILSSRWPVVVTPPAVGLLVITAGIAASVSAELARRRAPGPALLIAPTALLVLMATLAAPAGPPSFKLLSAFIVGVGIVLRRAAVVRQKAADPEALRHDSGRAPVVVGVVTAALALVPIVASGLLIDERRYDPRDERVDRPVTDEDLSPLTLVEEWKTARPTRVLFEATGAAVDRWRLVSLPRYNGRVWSPAADLKKVGARLDGGRPPANTIQQDVRVTLRALDGRWLPIPIGVPRSSDRVVRTDSAASGLLAQDPLRDGEIYQATIWTPTGITERLDRTLADSALKTVLGDLTVPPTISALALDITSGAKSDRERAERLATYLREKYRLDESAPSGHSLALLQLFLEQTKTGRSEQFVAAYGLLASAAGLPVRLTVGFDGRQSNGVISTDDVSAWPEVAYQGIGWVPVDPFPSAETPDLEPEGREQAPATPTTAPRNDATGIDDGTSEVAPTRGISRRTAVTVGIPVGVVLLIVAYIVAVLWLKRQRRYVRPDASLNDRVVESFLASTDLMLDLGIPIEPSATNRELVHAAARPWPAAAELLPLANSATRASYSSIPLPAAEAEDVLADAARFRELAKTLGPMRWWRARLSLRSVRKGLKRFRSTD